MRRFTRSFALAMVAIIAVLATALGSGPAPAQVPQAPDYLEPVRAAVDAFVPEGLGLPPGHLPSVSKAEPDFFGCDVHTSHVIATDADGGTWDLFFEVNARRFFVSHYLAAPKAPDSLLGPPVLSRADAEAIAREFAAARFPTPLERLELVLVSDPLPPHAGPLPVFSFHWTGHRGAIETGDRLGMSVSAVTGQVLVYSCFAAAPHTEEDVRVPVSDAVAAVRSLIEQRGGVDADTLRFESDLVLSHGQAADDGPVWRVFAIRPATADEDEDPRLLRYVDARSGEIIAPPMHEMLDGFFFGTDR